MVMHGTECPEKCHLTTQNSNCVTWPSVLGYFKCVTRRYKSKDLSLNDYTDPLITLSSENNLVVDCKMVCISGYSSTSLVRVQCQLIPVRIRYTKNALV